MSRYSTGVGPGPITDDGCAVELYRQIGPGDDPAIVASVVPAPSTLLDLGAGAGRLTHALVDLGYTLTAVDQSPDMLAEIRRAECVRSSIELLDLGNRTFDAVLLASYLLNTPDQTQRAGLLATCRRYVGPSGSVLIQVRNRRILEDLSQFERWEGAIRDVVERYSRKGALVSMTWRTEVAGSAWVQTFTQEFLEEEQLREELLRRGLGFEHWLDARHEWLKARPL